MNERKEIIKNYKLKIENLIKHNSLYHNDDNPSISDSQFDEIKKDFTNIGRDGDYEGILKTLSLAKKEVNDFFENVIVNDQDELIKKNRLELLQMLCKSFDNYLNFSKIESL